MKLYIERNGILIETFNLQADVLVKEVKTAKLSTDGRFHRSIKLIVVDAPPPESSEPDHDEEEYLQGGSQYKPTA